MAQGFSSAGGKEKRKTCQLRILNSRIGEIILIKKNKVEITTLPSSKFHYLRTVIKTVGTVCVDGSLHS